MNLYSVSHFKSLYLYLIRFITIENVKYIQILTIYITEIKFKDFHGIIL